MVDLRELSGGANGSMIDRNTAEREDTRTRGIIASDKKLLASKAVAATTER